MRFWLARLMTDDETLLQVFVVVYILQFLFVQFNTDLLIPRIPFSLLSVVCTEMTYFQTV